jgi:hypothetical protein
MQSILDITACLKLIKNWHKKWKKDFRHLYEEKKQNKLDKWVFII